MEICDFCSVMRIIREYISDSRALSQIDLLYEVFQTFMEDTGNADFDFDNAQVCRWMNGQSAVSPRICRYYLGKEMEASLTKDVLEKVLPLFYDSFMCVEKLHDLLMLDDTVSGMAKAHISEEFPCNNDGQLASVIGRLIHFILQRKFIKRGSENALAIAEGKLSPAISTYIMGCTPPNPCRYFVGRQEEIEDLHEALISGGKVFIDGVAGMGKSETAKAYARCYRKEYTNQIYIPYSGNLKKDIASLDFVNDPYGADEEELYLQHNRFLRTLREDTLLIIDNYSQLEEADPVLSEVARYNCHVLVTTRNLIDFGERFYLGELTSQEQIALGKNLFKDFDGDEYILHDILFSAHGHTFVIELIARLLNAGIMTPAELQHRLYYEGTGMSATDKIKISKDGVTSSATYAEHIRVLFGLYNLADDQLDILKCASLLADSGTSKRYFARWIGITDPNRINELIDLGLIYEAEGHKINTPAIIKDLVVTEFSPGVSDCKEMLTNIQHDCLLHGFEAPPYYGEMAEVIENALLRLRNDDKEFFLRMMEDAFAYYDRPDSHADVDFYLSVMHECIEAGAGDVRDKILYLDYQASRALQCGKDEQAFGYEKEAAMLMSGITGENALLYSNIHSNLGMMYYSHGDLKSAREHVEEGIRILKEFDLMHMHDTVPQACNFAMIEAVSGNPGGAMEILRETMKYVYDGSAYSTDYANIEETMGGIMAATGNRNEAIGHFKNVLRAHAEIYGYDINELWQVASRLCEYLQDKEQGLDVLSDYNRALCDKKIST